MYSLYGNYGIKPGQVDSYLQKLNNEIESRLPKISLAEFNNRTPSIEQRQDTIKAQYDKAMKALESHPDKDKIKAILDKAEFKINVKEGKADQNVIAAVHNTKVKFTPPIAPPQERTKSFERER
jgi:hypothetical protein